MTKAWVERLAFKKFGLSLFSSVLALCLLSRPIEALTCATRGAQLPIQYSLSTLPGTQRFIAPTGSDTTGNGSIVNPYQTLAKAHSASTNGDSIVIRGGTYAIIPNLYVSKRLTFIAYPGEIPVFEGSIPAPLTSTVEGNLRYFPYQPVPAAAGQGMGIANLELATFNTTGPTGKALQRGWRCVNGSNYYIPTPSGTDVKGCGPDRATLIAAYYPDQVFLNLTKLQQVLDKNLVAPGTFYLARSAATDSAPPVTNLYMWGADAADMTKIRVSSSYGLYISVASSGTRIEGIRIARHSPTWAAMALFVANVNDTIIRDVEITQASTISLTVSGNSNLAQLTRRTLLERVSVSHSGWESMSFQYTDDTTIRSCILANPDEFAEFYASPETGGMKATKNDRMRIENCQFSGGVSTAIWFDQSNYDASVADSDFINVPLAMFYEISHKLTMVNNFILCSHPSTITKNPCVKTAGSSGIRLIGNTIIGGDESISVLIDSRSKDYGSEHTVRYGQGGNALLDCNVDYNSEFDFARPGAYGTGPNLTPGMNWKPELDMLINNIFAYPTGFTYCGVNTILCVTSQYYYAGINNTIPSNQVIPPNATIDGNVYQPTTNIARVLGISSLPGAFSATTMAAYTGTSGLGSAWYGLTAETKGVAGSGYVNPDGSLTAALTTIQGQAYPVPTDPIINMYLPAGTQNYGRLSSACGSPSPAMPSPVTFPSPAPSPVKTPSPLAPTPTPLVASSLPTVVPSPLVTPSPSPVVVPTPSSAVVPTPSPAVVPTPSPVVVPSPSPVVVPTPSPVVVPTPSPAVVPTPPPDVVPTPPPVIPSPPLAPTSPPRVVPSPPTIIPSSSPSPIPPPPPWPTAATQLSVSILFIISLAVFVAVIV